SPPSGPAVMRARVGLRPNRPQQAAGMRMEPPPSVACAIGSRPAATAAAEPPLEPPGERLGFHGLCVGPNSAGSVAAERPNSEELVLPMTTRLAFRQRLTISLSAAGMLRA